MTEEKTSLWRISNLEKQVCELDGKVDNILSTHLPGIKESVTKLSGKIDGLSTKVSLAVGVNVLMIIGSIIGIVLIIRK